MARRGSSSRAEASISDLRNLEHRRVKQLLDRNFSLDQALLVQKYPWLPSSVYKAFCEAKALAMVDLLDVNALMVTLPWLIPETEETMAIMGKDFWPYGIAENMREITALTQYLHEQGLIERKVAVEELFHPSMFEISKV